MQANKKKLEITFTDDGRKIKIQNMDSMEVLDIVGNLIEAVAEVTERKKLEVLLDLTIMMMEEL